MRETHLHSIIKAVSWRVLGMRHIVFIPQLA